MRLRSPGAFVWLFVAVMAVIVTITICQPTGSINAHPSLQRANKVQGKTHQMNGTKTEEQDKAPQRNGTKSEEQGKVRQKNETKSEEQGTVRQKNGTKSEERGRTHQRTEAKMPCRDLNKNCKLWAAAGECDTNPAWMDVYCSKVCGKCDERELEELWELMNELQALQTKNSKEMQHMVATINDIKSNNERTRKTLDEVKETVAWVLRKVASMPRPPPLECDHSWIRYHWSCYKVFKTPFNHAQAKASCAANNAYLASIGSEEENSFVAGLIQAITYIGCSDEIHEGVWTWPDGSPFIYSKWTTNAPNNLGGNEDYCSMYTNSYWDDVHGGYLYQ